MNVSTSRCFGSIGTLSFCALVLYVAQAYAVCDCNQGGGTGCSVSEKYWYVGHIGFSHSANSLIEEDFGAVEDGMPCDTQPCEPNPKKIVGVYFHPKQPGNLYIYGETRDIEHVCCNGTHSNKYSPTITTSHGSISTNVNNTLVWALNVPDYTGLISCLGGCGTVNGFDEDTDQPILWGYIHLYSTYVKAKDLGDGTVKLSYGINVPSYGGGLTPCQGCTDSRIPFVEEAYFGIYCPETDQGTSVTVSQPQWFKSTDWDGVFPEGPPWDGEMALTVDFYGTINSCLPSGDLDNGFCACEGFDGRFRFPATAGPITVEP